MERRRLLLIVAVAALVLGHTPAVAQQLEDASGSTCADYTLLGPASGTSSGPACPGVRPGGMVKDDPSDTAGCTFNFLFQGSDGYRYIGTAGHCILEEEDASRTWSKNSPTAYDAGGKRIGHYAFAALKDVKDLDIALIRLDPGVEASPAMCEWGAPKRIYTDHSPDPVRLQHFGNGLLIGYVDGADRPGVMPAREAIATDTEDPRLIMAFGVAAFGDSGSGVLTEDGEAAGVLVAIGAGATSSGAWGDVFITRIDHQLGLAEKALGIRLELVTG